MTRLYDRSFPTQTCLNTVGQDPEHVVWRREGPADVAWFTDSCLDLAADSGVARRIAWILEPPDLRPDPYQYIEDHPGVFEAVVSFVSGWKPKGTRHYLYRPGGTRLPPADRQMLPRKDHLLSIIASAKRGMEGHRLRHDLIRLVGPRLKSFGPEYRQLPRGGSDKVPALRPFMFTVVTENCRRDMIFSEKLIDAFLTCTIPIYWGCPSIGHLFDTGGMIVCNDLGDLHEAVVEVLAAGEAEYARRRDAVAHNYHCAQDYLCTEDWMFKTYPWLFEESP